MFIVFFCILRYFLLTKFLKESRNWIFFFFCKTHKYYTTKKLMKNNLKFPQKGDNQDVA